MVDSFVQLYYQETKRALHDLDDVPINAAFFDTGYEFRNG